MYDTPTQKCKMKILMLIETTFKIKLRQGSLREDAAAFVL